MTNQLWLPESSLVIMQIVSSYIEAFHRTDSEVSDATEPKRPPKIKHKLREEIKSYSVSSDDYCARGSYGG